MNNDYKLILLRHNLLSTFLNFNYSTYEQHTLYKINCDYIRRKRVNYDNLVITHSTTPLLLYKHGKSEYKTIFYPFLVCGHQIWPRSVKSKHNCLKKETSQQDNKTKEEFSKSEI